MTAPSSRLSSGSVVRNFCDDPQLHARTSAGRVLMHSTERPLVPYLNGASREQGGSGSCANNAADGSQVSVRTPAPGEVPPTSFHISYGIKKYLECSAPMLTHATTAESGRRVSRLGCDQGELESSCLMVDDRIGSCRADAEDRLQRPMSFIRVHAGGGRPQPDAVRPAAGRRRHAQQRLAARAAPAVCLRRALRR